LEHSFLTLVLLTRPFPTSSRIGGAKNEAPVPKDAGASS
jgi:hypothetical protein